MTTSKTSNDAEKSLSTDGDTPWLTSDELQLWRTWRLATQGIDAELARDLQRTSTLSMSEYSVLVHLSEHPEHRYRFATLAAILDWDRSRLSHQIRRMAKRGLVRRDECVEDGRGAFVVLEPEGMRLIAEAAPHHVRSLRDLLFDILSGKDVTDLTRILSKVGDHLSELEPCRSVLTNSPGA